MGVLANEGITEKVRNVIFLVQWILVTRTQLEVAKYVLITGVSAFWGTHRFRPIGPKR